MITVFLDLDGTLLDPKPGITGSIRAALAELGAEVPEADALTWCIGPPLRQSFEVLIGPGGDIEAAVDAYREHYRAGAMFEADLYDGVGEMLMDLRNLASGLYIATSKTEVDAIKIAEHFDLAPFMDRVFGAEADGSRSDKAELLAHALTETRAEAAIMLGDRRYDIEGARLNGLPAIGALWGYGELDELREVDADALAAVPEEVADLVVELMGLSE